MGDGFSTPRGGDVLGTVKIDRYRSIRFDSREVVTWDTALLVFVRACLDWADFHRLESLLEGLPEGASNLVKFPRRSQS